MKVAPASIARRPFLAGGLGLALQAQQESAVLTAAAVIDRFKANVGVPWRAQTVDNLVGAPPRPR